MLSTMQYLRDICELMQETCDPQVSKSNVYVELEHIDPGRFHLARHGSPQEVTSAKNCFRAGDVLYGKLRPYLDKAVVAETDGICSTDILVLRPKDGTHPFYVAGVIHSHRFIDYSSQTTHGLNHPRTSWTALQNFPVFPHSIPERQKIGEVVHKMQQALEVQEDMIAKTRELNRSTLNILLTGQKSL